MLLRVMDLEEVRELEEEIRRLWVEIPRERMESRHDIEHVDKEYILDPYGEIRIWYCRDSDGERFVVLVFRYVKYFYEWGERREVWRIAQQLATRERLLSRLIPPY
jgi:hypothetical protein